METTLLRSYDVLVSGYVSPTYPGNMLCPHIRRKEKTVFEQCFLGATLYAAMLADINTFTTSERFNQNKEYNLNEIVEFEGCFFKSLKNENNVSPEDSSLSNPEWEKQQRFKSACYNGLWEDSLMDYITLKVIYTSIRYATYLAGGTGLMKNMDDSRGRTTVTLEEFNGWKLEVLKDSEESLKNVYNYILANQENCNFVSITESDLCSEDGACNRPLKTNRRMLFKY